MYKFLHESKSSFLWHMAGPLLSLFLVLNWVYFKDRAKGSPDRLDVSVREKERGG